MSSIDGLINEAKNVKSKLIVDEKVLDELIANATSLLHNFEAMNKVRLLLILLASDEFYPEFTYNYDI